MYENQTNLRFYKIEMERVHKIVKIVKIVSAVYEAYNLLKRARRKLDKARASNQSRASLHSRASVRSSASARSPNSGRIKDSSRPRRIRVQRIAPPNATEEQLKFHKNCVQLLKQKSEEFYKATRMSAATFEILLNLLDDRLQKISRRRPIDPETRLGVTLLYLAHGYCIRFLVWSHKFGLSTVRKIIYETCEAIWEELHPIYLAEPTASDFVNIANGFYKKTGLPHCLGPLDGKQITITVFSAYKRTDSSAVIASCNTDYLFTFVDIAEIGKRSQSDLSVFSESAFGKQILENKLDVPSERTFTGTKTKFPFFFVGDSGFPLRHNLMRPYPGNDLSWEKENFNKKLSQVQMYMENTFGILSHRWNVLQKPINASLDNADKIVLATMMLHNFIMLENDSQYFTPDLVDHVENECFVLGTWRESPLIESFKPSNVNRPSAIALKLRDLLSNDLQKT